MWHKRMFKKGYEADLNRLAGQIYKSPAKCRVLIEDNAKWYWLTIIRCGIAVISIICNILQLIF